jgi:hypothetical protein
MYLNRCLVSRQAVVCVASWLVFQWFLKVETIGRSNVSTCAFVSFLKRKVSRGAKNAYQTLKLRAVGWESPPPPLSLKKGEGKRLVLLAAGPAVVFGTFSWILYFFISSIMYTRPLNLLGATTPPSPAKHDKLRKMMIIMTIISIGLNVKILLNNRMLAC